MGFSRSTCCWQPPLGNPTAMKQEYQAPFLPFACQYSSLVRKSCPRENESRVFDLIPKYPFLGTGDAQAPSEASHVVPCLLGVNMTVLFLRVPWETEMLFQLGETPGPSLPNPSSPHTEPAIACWHVVPTTGQSTTSTTQPYPACLGSSRFIKPGQMCMLGWKPVVQNLV